MSSVTVHDMRTETLLTYVGITPEQAVVAAHEQARGNHNTWTYSALLPKVETGRFFVFMGDFAARRAPLAPASA